MAQRTRTGGVFRRRLSHWLSHWLSHRLGRRLRVGAAQFVTLLFLGESLAQDAALKLAFENEPARTLRSVRQKNVVLVSLNDIAQALSLSVKENPSDLSLEVRQKSLSVTFFPGNPFVVLAEPGKEKKALQLTTDVFYSLQTFYAPVASLAPVMEQAFGVNASYNVATNTLLAHKSRPAFDITAMTFDQKANGILVRIPTERRLPDAAVIFKEDGWVYVTLPGAKGDVASLKKIKPSGAIKRILVNQYATSLQLALRVDDKITAAEILREESPNGVVILLRGAGGVPITGEHKKSESRADLDEQRKKYELDVIVLDAGHGGKDPGTIGVKGTYEKNIALGIALKLGKLIKKNLKSVEVVYTRDDDTFVELDRRGQIANEANGKLFISIHCNAMPRRPHPRRGFEVYLLRPGRTDEAIEIAERENSVIELEEGYEQRYQKLTDENFILVTMAQTAHMRGSETFAEFAAGELDKHVDTPSNGVKQAGFYVLVGASMPNVLIETAYLSNREDEKMLRSESGQQKYADAIFSAIKRYKREHEKLLLEGKELGATKREE